MNVYKRLFSYEIKNIFRDNMTATMVVYPLVMTLFGAYLIPLIIDQFDVGPGVFTASIIILIVLASLAPMLAGSMLGFLLLDHKDENTLDSLRVTPVSLTHYLTFKSIYTYGLSVLSSLVILYGVKYLSGDGYTYLGSNVWQSITPLSIVTFSVVSALFAPVFGLLIATLGNNKIEGFAYLKSLGILILVPALVTLDVLQDIRQYALGIVPTFWPVKGLLESASLTDNAANLSSAWYSVIGTVYLIGLCVLFIRLFIRRIAH